MIFKHCDARYTQEKGLVKYEGQKCEVIRPLTLHECDIDEVGPMFEIMFSDGQKFNVFEDELEEEN